MLLWIVSVSLILMLLFILVEWGWRRALHKQSLSKIGEQLYSMVVKLNGTDASDTLIDQISETLQKAVRSLGVPLFLAHSGYVDHESLGYDPS